VADIPDSDWKIAVGHHPSWQIDVCDFTGVLQQADFDLHLHGHTHALGYYKVDGARSPPYVLTGAGSLVRVHREKDVPLPLAQSHTHDGVWYKKIAGFTHHAFNADATKLTTKFISHRGDTLYEFTIEKDTH
jgi:hypothetical protein